MIYRIFLILFCLLYTLNGFSQSVNNPSASTYPQSTSNQNISGFSLSGFNSTATLLVTIGLVNPPSGTTLRLGNTSGISASTGYTLSSNFTRISFTGTQANVNTVLSSLLLNTGSVPGNVYIAVTATVNPTGYFYFPPNGHFYRPMSSGGITYTNAKSGAAAQTFKGQTGYLVTITSQDEQNFINANVPVSNIWFALSDVGLEGRWRIDAGPESGTLVWTASANVNNSTTGTYSSAGTTAPGQFTAWAPSEPNNADGMIGEDHAVTKWSGANNWNDLRDGNTAQVGGYVVEFGTWTDPADQTFTDFSTGFVTHQIGCTAANSPVVPSLPGSTRMGNGTTVLNATPPSGSVIDWYANATGGNVLAGGSGVSTFTITSPASSITYHAQSRNASTGCVSSSRTAVNVLGLPPTANNDTVAAYNAPVNIIPTTNDVAGGSPIVPTSIQFLAGTAPNASTVGVFVINPNGSVTFTAASNYTGVATIGYRIFDQDNQSATAYIVVNVIGCNTANAPAAPSLPSSTRMGNGTMVLNATPPSGSVIDWYADATGGNVLAGGSGVSTFTITSPANSISYYTQSRNTSTGCVSSSRTAVNVLGFPPNANNDTAETVYNAPVNIIPTANDVAGGSSLVVTSIQFIAGTAPNASTVGVFVINPNGSITFTASNYLGIATIGYRIFDQDNQSDSAYIVINVLGCNASNTPAEPSSPSSTRMGNGTTVLNATAPSGSVIDWYANATGGNVLSGGLGVSTFTVTSTAAAITYYAQSRNSTTGCVSSSRTAVIVPSLIPNAINDTTATAYNVPVNITPTANDVVGGSPLVATSIQFLTGTAPNASTVGVFVINPNGTVTFTAASNYSGVATIGYRIFDQDNQSDSAYIVVNVSGPCSVDGDFDGIADCLDEYPTDTYKAFNNYFPPNDYATLMYEDLWPHTGDYDLNDVVINYQANTITNGLNQVVEMNYTIVARCTGAGLHNGFAFQLDNVPSNKITSVSGAKASGASWLSIGSNGLENGQSFANVIVYDDLYKVLPYPGSGTVINTEMSAARTPNDTSNIVITFINDGVVPSGGTISISNLPHTAFNPYLILGDSGTLNQIRSKELHLADRVPSSKMDFSLFGTKKDNSNPGQGRYYKTANNLPWALQISTSVPYMQEKEDIATGYLKFLDWATSNGTTNTNWYLDLVGHRDVLKLYTK
jgi:LruC domain-containing protein